MNRGLPSITYAPRGQGGGSSLLYISIAYYMQKAGKGVQIARKIAYILNGRPDRRILMHPSFLVDLVTRKTSSTYFDRGKMVPSVFVSVYSYSLMSGSRSGRDEQTHLGGGGGGSSFLYISIVYHIKYKAGEGFERT